MTAYIVHRCERAGRRQVIRRSGSARRIGRRPATSFRKKTCRDVAERDARVVPGKRTTRVRSVDAERFCQQRCESVAGGNKVKRRFERDTEVLGRESVQTFSTSERQAFVWGAAACTHFRPPASPPEHSAAIRTNIRLTLVTAPSSGAAQAGTLNGGSAK